MRGCSLEFAGRGMARTAARVPAARFNVDEAALRIRRLRVPALQAVFAVGACRMRPGNAMPGTAVLHQSLPLFAAARYMAGAGPRAPDARGRSGRLGGFSAVHAGYMRPKGGFYAKGVSKALNGWTAAR